jgi:predicted acetyltransferase
MPLAHETNSQGVGIMYRIIDIPGIFNTLRSHRFGAVTMCLKITIIDSFYRSNAGSTIVCFTDGSPAIRSRGRYDAEITCDISDFSSLLAGAVTFKDLYRLGLADISHERYAGMVDLLFRTAEKPLCLTQF